MSGPDRIRTDNPLNANQTLYQFELQIHLKPQGGLEPDQPSPYKGAALPIVLQRHTYFQLVKQHQTSGIKVLVAGTDSNRRPQGYEP